MSALPIPVTQTEPPSMAVAVLGLELRLLDSQPDAERVDLVCLGIGGVQVLHGIPARATPVCPTLIEGLSPIAKVHIKRAQAAVFDRDITLLASDGTPELAACLVG